MPTKRRSKSAKRRGMPITPVALDAFAKMLELERQCTCAPTDWGGEYWKQEECPACKAWWDQHFVLHQELKLTPGDWPAVEDPDAVSPYPEDSPAALADKPDLAARRRYRALLAALEERRA